MQPLACGLTCGVVGAIGHLLSMVLSILTRRWVLDAYGVGVSACNHVGTCGCERPPCPVGLTYPQALDAAGVGDGFDVTKHQAPGLPPCAAAGGLGVQ